MRGRAALAIWLAGCSFRPGAAAVPDAAERDGKSAGDASPLVDAAPSAAGSLVVTPVAVPPGDLNLTTEGTLDWAHWGYTGATSFDRKTSGNAISGVTVVGSSTQLQIISVSVTATWTNGTPDTAATQTGTGTGIQFPDGLRLTVPAGTSPHTLRVYVGGRGSRGRLDAALTDSSASKYTDNMFQGTLAWHAQYTIVYNAATDGQSLTVTWYDDGDSVAGGFEMLLSATLQ